MEPTPSTPSSPLKPRHTNIQRAVLALNIVVVLACLVGAFALIYGKDQLDARLQTEKAEVQTTLATVPPQVTTGDSGAGDQKGLHGVFPDLWWVFVVVEVLFGTRGKPLYC